MKGEKIGHFSPFTRQLPDGSLSLMSATARSIQLVLLPINSPAWFRSRAKVGAARNLDDRRRRSGTAIDAHDSGRQFL